MSQELYGTEKEKEKMRKAVGTNIPPLNPQLGTLMVPVDIESDLNRRTEARQCTKLLTSLGGFQPRRWNAPSVARILNEGGKLVVWDGDHSRALFMAAYPEATHMPARVEDFADRKEISLYFDHAGSSKGSKNLKKDETLIHLVRAENVLALETHRQLEECGLCVSLGTGEPDSIVGSQQLGAHQTPSDAFRKTIANCGLPSTRRASSLLRKMYPEDKNIQAELLHGMAIVFSKGEITGYSAREADFTNTMIRMAGKKQAAFARTTKGMGGNITNKQALCTARGIEQTYHNHASLENSTVCKSLKPLREYLARQLDD
jgi:hypothetical protein